MDKVLQFQGKELKLTNLDKRFWDEGLTKADLIKYYVDIAPYILKYLKNRPFVMVRYPDGIDGKFFYQKNCPQYAPNWIDTYPVFSGRSTSKIDFIVCNDVETLVWLANQGCVEAHVWLSQIETIYNPDIAVFDLDPVPPATFEDSLGVALLIKEALAEFNLEGFPKSSGASGMHIFVPIEPKYTYDEVKEFIAYISKLIVSVYPSKTSMERIIKKRRGKVYLDYLQNGWGRTMAWVYSLRPQVGAPVSTPVEWKEVEEGFNPYDFNIETIFSRIEEKGDLFEPILKKRQSLDEVLKKIFP